MSLNDDNDEVEGMIAGVCAPTVQEIAVVFCMAMTFGIGSWSVVPPQYVYKGLQLCRKAQHAAFRTQ